MCHTHASDVRQVLALLAESATCYYLFKIEEEIELYISLTLCDLGRWPRESEPLEPENHRSEKYYGLRWRNCDVIKK